MIERLELHFQFASKPVAEVIEKVAFDVMIGVCVGPAWHMLIALFYSLITAINKAAS